MQIQDKNHTTKRARKSKYPTLNKSIVLNINSESYKVMHKILNFVEKCKYNTFAQRLVKSYQDF